MHTVGLVVWLPEYSLDVPEIDDQHRKLIEIIRSFQEAMLEGRASSSLTEILRKLRIYAEVHFALEERLMEEAGYPGLAAHRTAHEELTEQVGIYQDRFQSGQAIPSVEMMLFMRDWLTSHILAMDKKMGPHLRRARGE
jgi:hemerythrin-like metal-binding protein